jgi:hypothetical protein
MIKTALIPPLGWEQYFKQSDRIQMTLCIPHLLASAGYLKAMGESLSRGDWVIMDNGAVDGGLVTDAYLKNAAQDLEVDEVVLPDVIGNKNLTREKVRQYLRLHNTGKRYMAVLQGIDETELQTLVKNFVDDELITILGIPRDHIVRIRKGVRIDLANWIEENYPSRFKIHLLGTSSHWIDEVKFAAKYAPHIRSVDTSAPFVYTLRNMYLGDEAARNYKAVGRPENYLKGKVTFTYPPLVDRNIEAFKRWAKGEEAGL